ncbi:MAG: IS605 OrfB-like transposable element containing RNAse H-like and Zn finger domain [Candidatus Methanohalarchaeum thermophilum]|uniref:IS605 OrfB-like transposable element containing RNAse H-like and Zn finger domain n=1 Tax=Methanohalarchaeum thermophilum TaxID=1903181 RepID=A0A1Q6DTU5_METT1|nr:MAG: IS605 OrfB-like transposable element containing RNAse H-like and Zn finger domain [Candidatus Methanohalarchaeum thermophilum]
MVVWGCFEGLGGGGTGKGAGMNWVANTMPYHKLTVMIVYKVEERGVRVVGVGERLSSKTCHCCGSEDTGRLSLR